MVEYRSPTPPEHHPASAGNTDTRENSMNLALSSPGREGKRKVQHSDDGLALAASQALSTQSLEPDGGDFDMPASKKRKKNKKNKSQAQDENLSSRESGSTRPTLKYAELHKLQNIIKISDLQSLVIYCLADGVAPQFVSVSHHAQIRKAVVLLVPGLELDMFAEMTAKLEQSSEQDATGGTINGLEAKSRADDAARRLEYDPHETFKSKTPDDYLPHDLTDCNLPSALQPLTEVFDRVWPVKTPGDDRYSKIHSPIHAMLNAPIPKSAEEKKLSKELNGATPVKGHEWKAKRTPITEFVMTLEQQLENEYAVHPSCFLTNDENTANDARRQAQESTAEYGWKDTAVSNLDEAEVPEAKIEAGSLTAGRDVYSIDCEMCMVGPDEFALTRMSIVDWGGDIVLDELIKPEKPVTEYLTAFSGITQEMLADVNTTLADLQCRLLALFHPRSILIGHSLESDLRAMKMTHPFVVDTSLLYPHPKGPPLKSSLKWLTQRYLNRSIQQGHGSSGHDSVEDARAALDLVKQKCEKGPGWGENGQNSESVFKRIARSRNRANALGMGGASTTAKYGAVVDHGAPERTFGNLASHSIGCKDDNGVVEGVRRCVLGDPDGAYVPGGGLDFTWARLRDLEGVRGWRADGLSAGGDEAKPVQAMGGLNGQDNDDEGKASATGSTPLEAAVQKTASDIRKIHSFLPPCTLFVVYSGPGDVRELYRLQEMHKTYRKEFNTKKWDDLSVRWTDVEEQAMKRACAKARRGAGFMCVT